VKKNGEDRLDMKDMTIYAFIYVALLFAGCSYGGDGNLPDKLIDVTLSHIHKHGPDEDTAQFISMDSLLPFMLEDPPATRSLPYLFRKAYGVATVPYLRKAIAEAKSEAIRQKVEKILKILKEMRYEETNLHYPGPGLR